MKNNKGFIGMGVILAIIAVLVVGCGAYYFGTKNNSVLKNPMVGNSQSVEVQDNISPIDLNWKTYSDVDAGYELKYPSDWIMDIGTVSTTYPSPIIKMFKSFRLTTEKVNVDKSGEGWHTIVPKGETLKVGDFQLQIFQYPYSMTTSIKELINNGMDAPKDLKTDYIKGITNMKIGDTIREVSVMGDDKSAKRIEFVVSDKLFIFDFDGSFYKNGEPSFGPDEETYKKYLPVFDTILKDFKITQSITTSEDSSSETFENQPGAIKSIKVNGINNWTLAVDLLSKNPNWLPGVDSTGEFFINQNPKIRNLNVTRDTKAYNCGFDMKPDVLVNTTTFISNIQKSSYKTVYFDIKGTNITSIYQQCLP